jgi:benzoyl-CoA reductase subunit A
MTSKTCYIGIDLGSTTTKALLLDEDGAVLGRGITNSRANYDVACAVARTDALVDARMRLVRDALEAAPDIAASGAEILPAVDRSFREAKHRSALSRLREISMSAIATDRLSPWQASLGWVLPGLFDAMEEQAQALFDPGAERRSDFFRDIASSQYMRLAEERSDRKMLPLDVLVSVFDRAIIVVENEQLDLSFEDHAARVLDRVLAGTRLPEAMKGRAREVLQGALRVELVAASLVGTGYGRARLPFPKENIRSEILCHGLGAHSMFPQTATVLDIGGQDTKAIQLDAAGLVTSFQMNDRCAAGCGRYLGYIADEMNMGVHELGPLAMQATRTVRINSTCTVFAGAELRDRLNLGQRREDILAGLHRAIMLRAMSLLARSGGVKDEFTFTGGVARNQAAVKALVELVEENYGQRKLNISADSIYTGALGAALFAMRAVEQKEVAA